MKLYFDSLPEPVVPFSHYDDFRTPLGGQHAQVVGTRAPLAYQEIGYFHPDNAIRIYRKLIRNLPPVNRQLLVYMLYFFAVFADKSNTNKATPSVLARSFQRGILSHPRHIDSDKDKKLNQDVIIFLIVKHHFLLGSLDL